MKWFYTKKKNSIIVKMMENMCFRQLKTRKKNPNHFIDQIIEKTFYFCFNWCVNTFIFIRDYVIIFYLMSCTIYAICMFGLFTFNNIKYKSLYIRIYSI